jgi:flagellar hook-associated protein 1 FlgK
MSTLISSLYTASNSLAAFSKALGVDETNVSNSSTAGYVAQRASIQPIGFGGQDGIADSVDITSTGNSQADAIVQAANSAASESSTTATQLTPVNQLFDITGSSGILAAFQQFSTAFSNLSVTPNDPTLQSTALTAAGSVATAFNSVAASLDTQQSQVDSSIQSTVSQINTLSSQIQQYNVQALSESQVDPGTDASRRSALQQLSSLVDINVTTNADGTVSVLAGGSQPLVIGDQAYTLSANPAAAAGSQITSSGGGASPSAYSGQLGALLQVSNGTLSQLLGGNGNPGSLNTLAEGFASRVNTLLSSGVTSSGAAGVPVFTYDTSNASNVARTLAVDPTVTGSQLASATTGTSAQSNGIANELGALAASNNTADQIDGLSPQGLFASIAAGVGQQLSDANTQSTSDQAVLTSAQSSQQQASGVSLDQEAVTITAFQRAYQASAQVVTILNQLTSDAVSLISSAGTP